MALTYRTLYKSCDYLQNITKPVKWSVGKKYPIRILASGICYQNTYAHRPLIDTQEIPLLSEKLRHYSTSNDSSRNYSSHNDSSQKGSSPNRIHSGSPPDNDPASNKEGLIKKFKTMYRDYWYVLIPVHVATSIVWFGSCYYAVRSGVDILALLQSLGVSESLISPLRDSAAGYFALALALYKLVTPLRYAVTIGGTTIAIKKLTAIGWIKPVPSKERIKEIFQEKRDTLQDRFKESRHHYQEQMKERRSQVMQEMKRYKSEMRNIKNKVKKS